MSIRFDILTLFPEIFESFLGQSILKSAIDQRLVEVHRWNIRDWTHDKHRSVDDRPYGGGPGMVLRPEPVFECVESVQQLAESGTLIALTPKGDRFTQEIARELAGCPRLLLLCGRYEGFDERIIEGLGPWEISIGEYVTNGGEVPAMVMIEAVTRLVPGVLGDEASATEDTFCRPGWVEYPQYTRPAVFRNIAVPDVLLSGNHEAIARWRTEQAAERSKHERNVC